jgi:dethiobiotin synthetase
LAAHRSPFTPRGFFVTGTDTDVGKTLVTCALLHAYAARGARVVGMKPVAAGAHQANDGLVNEDVERIRAAGNVSAPHALVNPYCFVPPIAPHIAAHEAGVEIELGRIELAYRDLAQRADVTIVEGAGGFMVPLNSHETNADLAQCLGLSVLLVVGMRLGCLSHALLTAQAIRASGLRLAGWVANHIDPRMPRGEANVAALTDRLAAPLIARIEFSRAVNPQLVAGLLALDRLAICR